MWRSKKNSPGTGEAVLFTFGILRALCRVGHRPPVGALMLALAVLARSEFRVPGSGFNGGLTPCRSVVRCHGNAQNGEA